MYILDASSMIHAWENYPIENFPPFWNWFETQVESARFSMPGVAYEEVVHKWPECGEWLKRNGVERIPLTNEILSDANRIRELLEISNDGYNQKGVGENDLFIIATALMAKKTLVSEEGVQFKLPLTRSRYKIPAVCALPEVGVKCMNLIELIRLEKAVFQS